MARGYKDFFGYSIFPFYGTLIKESGAQPFTASGITETVFSVNRKGLLIGFDFSCVEGGAVERIGYTLSVLLDGCDRFILESAYTDDINGTVSAETWGKLTYLEYDNAQFAWSLRKEIPFAQSIEIKATAIWGVNIPRWEYKAAYTLMI